MVSICFSSDHGLYVRGASASPRPPYVDEVDEARKVVNRVTEILTAGGFTCKKFHDDTSRSVDQNLATICNWHNSQLRDRDISCHFNAYSVTSKPMGTEVWHKTQASLASTVSSAMSAAAGFINRGAKQTNNLYFLNKTAKPSLLLEVCFVDSSADCDLYRKNFEALCRRIAETIASVTLSGTEPEPIPPEPEPEPPPVTGAHVLDVTTKYTGNPSVVVNDEMVHEGDAGAGTVDISLRLEGDVEVIINGELFQVGEPGEPETPATQRPTIGRGDQGDQVVVVQNALSVTPADGIFGPQTEQAVINYQRAEGIAADGIVGPTTWAHLEEDFELPPYEPPTFAANHSGIICSVFGGNADPNDSAYPPYDFITDKELSCALPWKFAGTRPTVHVRNRANGKEVYCQIRDVGPWLVDDDKYCLGDSRPVAEPKGSIIPRGKNQGKTSNGAGLDLTPAAAKAIGLSGMGEVDWRFVEDVPSV